MELETIDKLFLELSQFTTARTAKEIALSDRLKSARDLLMRWAVFYSGGCDSDFKLNLDTNKWLAEDGEG
jgi:hypothetical protein